MRPWVPQDERPVVGIDVRLRNQLPFELELNLLIVVPALVLDGELSARWDPEAFPGDLDPEGLVLLERVRQAPKFGYKFRRGVDAFDVSFAFFH